MDCSRTSPQPNALKIDAKNKLETMTGAASDSHKHNHAVLPADDDDVIKTPSLTSAHEQREAAAD